MEIDNVHTSHDVHTPDNVYSQGEPQTAIFDSSQATISMHTCEYVSI